MCVEYRPYIIVNVGNHEEFLLGERSLLKLFALGEASQSQWLHITPFGFVAFFASGRAGFFSAESLVNALRDAASTDSEMSSSLTVGVAEGELVGEYDQHGNLARHSPLIGDARVQAARNNGTPEDALRRLAEIKNRI